MKRPYITFYRFPFLLFLLVSAVCFSGCNDDIFVKETFFTDKSFKIQGDGGSCLIKYRPKNLKDVGISVRHVKDFDIDTFDRNGKSIGNDSPFSKIGQQVYMSPDLVFFMDIDEKHIQFNCVEHSVLDNDTVTLTFDYGATSEIIDISVSAGLPKEFVRSSLDVTKCVSVPDDYIRRYSSAVNESADTVMTVINPYKNSYELLNFEPDQDWAEELEYYGEIPCFENGKVVIKDMPRHSMAILGYNSIHPDNDSLSLVAEPVKIPPRCRAVCHVKYLLISMPFSAVYRNPVTQRAFSATGTCTLSVPSSYEILISNIEK